MLSSIKNTSGALGSRRPALACVLPVSGILDLAGRCELRRLCQRLQHIYTLREIFYDNQVQ